MLHVMEKNLTTLLIMAQNGDNSAYAEFLTVSANLLKRVLSKWIKNSEIREELIQETLISIHQNMHTFKSGLKAEPWVSTIAKYKTIDYLRKNKHQFQELTEAVTNEHSFSNTTLNSEEGHWEELREVFMIELEKLDNTSREAIIKTKIEGKTTKIAAVELGIKENAMRTRISRGVLRLKNSILGLEE